MSFLSIDSALFTEKMLMKYRIASIVVAALLFIMLSPTQGHDDIKYTIQVDADGSASWLIMQSGTNIYVSPDNLTQFQNNVTALLEIAENVTGRQMSAQAISITSTISGSYVIVQYKFLWQNFSTIEGSEIKIGDTFEVTDMFLRLQGDGEVVLNYPSTYEPKSVSPTPFSQDNSHQTVTWLGTKNLVGNATLIVLQQRPANDTPSGFVEFVSRNYVLILVVAAVTSISLNFYLSRRHSRSKKSELPPTEPSGQSVTESGEETILKLLRSSQGSLRQSKIVEQCRFSKAKTSQLLSALESRGVVRREKKGRDKIVLLFKQDEDVNRR